MKAIVLAILLLSPALIIAPCATNDPPTANVASVNCKTCVPFANTAANAPVACATCNAQFKLTTASPADCDACTAGTYSADGNTATTCMACGTNCAACTTGGNTMCTSCKTGFNKPAGSATGTCVTNIANCDVHGIEGVCTTCGTGKTNNMASPNVCVTAIADCTTLGAEGVCTACGTGKSVTTASPNTCVTSIANCKTHASATSCTMCNDGFFKKLNTNAADTCITPAAAIMHCKTYGDVETKCTTCMTGYTLTPGTSPAADTCVTKIANCKTFESDTLCKECASGYTVASDKTKCNQNQQGSAAGIFSALSVALLAFIALLN